MQELPAPVRIHVKPSEQPEHPLLAAERVAMATPEAELKHKQTQMAELSAKVFAEAYQSIQEGDKAGLVDLLNALDSVLAKEAVKPPAEISNAVYKSLLHTEKQRAYESIKTIQSEIMDLQGKLSHHSKHNNLL